DMEYMGPVCKAVSFESQAKIARVAKRLEDVGEIVRNYNGDFDFLQMFLDSQFGCSLPEHHRTYPGSHPEAGRKILIH
ncbi:MAG: hypothetical protein II070_07325, partial [Treponema sp.]|nr:hypothetical protein [Treponema sp.]